MAGSEESGDRDPAVTPRGIPYRGRTAGNIWGFDEIDLLPLRFFVVASRVGGQVLGAYRRRADDRVLLAIPGVKPGGCPYLHSHMMGVLPEYRNAGVGRRLKLRQREDALARGIR